MRVSPRKFLVLVAALTVLAGFTVYQGIAGDKPANVLAGPTPVQVMARALPLNEADPSVRLAGRVRYVAGWALSADNGNFGGFSGLVTHADGRLVAVSDRGDWLEARFDPRADTPLMAAEMRPFSADAQGMSKEQLDSESVIAAGDGYLVSFEGEHRLVNVAADGSVSPSVYTGLMDFTGVANNSGLEAITFSRGRLLALPERGVDFEGRLKGWLVNETASDPIYFRPPSGYSPTDAATMKNGDILILLRRYSPLEGVAAKLVRIPASAIEVGAVLEGEELLHLDPPYTVDNMEGLDVIERDGEAPLVVMISDDNFRKSQRTLLLVFALETT